MCIRLWTGASGQSWNGPCMLTATCGSCKCLTDSGLTSGQALHDNVPMQVAVLAAATLSSFKSRRARWSCGASFGVKASHSKV